MKAILTAMAMLIMATLLVGCGEERSTSKIDETRQDYFEYLANQHVYFEENRGAISITEYQIWVDEERYFTITEKDIPEIVKTIEQERAVKIMEEPEPVMGFDSGRQRLQGFLFFYEGIPDNPSATEAQTMEEKRGHIDFIAKHQTHIEQGSNSGKVVLLGITDGKEKTDSNFDDRWFTFYFSEEDFPEVVKAIEREHEIRIIGGLNFVGASGPDSEVFEFRFEPVE